MSKLEVFEPAMCCATGVCGVDVDPTLVLFSSALMFGGWLNMVSKSFGTAWDTMQQLLRPIRKWSASCMRVWTACPSQRWMAGLSPSGCIRRVPS